MQVYVCIEHISSLFFGSCNWEVYLDMYGALVIPISIFLVISFSHDYLPHKNKKVHNLEYWAREEQKMF